MGPCEGPSSKTTRDQLSHGPVIWLTLVRYKGPRDKATTHRNCQAWLIVETANVAASMAGAAESPRVWSGPLRLMVEEWVDWPTYSCSIVDNRERGSEHKVKNDPAYKYTGMRKNIKVKPLITVHITRYLLVQGGVGTNIYIVAGPNRSCEIMLLKQTQPPPTHLVLGTCLHIFDSYIR